jgi:hypothetical protein
MNNFVSRPIEKVKDPQTHVPDWTKGKMIIDPWSLRIQQYENISTPLSSRPCTPDNSGWEPFEQTPNDWALPPTPEPPSRPTTTKSKTTDTNHASMHWSFCHDYNCPYHRGHDSYHY